MECREKAGDTGFSELELLHREARRARWFSPAILLRARSAWHTVW